MLGSHGIVPVNEITFGYTFGVSSTFLEVKDRLLDVKHVAQRFVYHTQMEEGFSGRQIGSVVTYYRHQQGICSALIELEHSVRQLPGHS